MCLIRTRLQTFLTVFCFCLAVAAETFTPDLSADRPFVRSTPFEGLHVRPLYAGFMAATTSSESTPQRLAAIRAQMSLLSDYL